MGSLILFRNCSCSIIDATSRYSMWLSPFRCRTGIIARSTRCYAQAQGPGHTTMNARKRPVRNAPKPEEDIRKIRNIGVMAHIDAGKTTTTERMLYYSGFMRHLGDVDDGDTVMDYMEQERSRGITITSAAITFFWKKHKINLIDTPGHVDFTLEVERSLRVLDGAVAILDASAGVEAQTLTVWRQADRYCVPRIIFLNKMDKAGADFSMCIQSIQDKLHAIPLVTHIPIGQERAFSGVVDLVAMQSLTWGAGDGSKFQVADLSRDGHGGSLFEEASHFRSKLIEQLADMDERIGELFLADADFDELPPATLKSALRQVALSHKGVPVLCGSSLKNKGVQPLLDSIVDYLPNPTERTHDFVEYYKGKLCALAFKIIHDKQRGPLTFVRLYSGQLQSGGPLYNVNQECTETVSRVMQMYADEHKDIAEAEFGNIVAVAGLKETRTGDTLVASAKVAHAAMKAFTRSHPQQQQQQQQQPHDADREEEEVEEEDSRPSLPVLAALDVPDPVFFCSIEPPSVSQQVALEQALVRLTREDPSLRVHTDADTGQMILSGMGELHLEVIQDRIAKEYGVQADLGPLQIAYRETIGVSAEETVTLDRSIGEHRHLVTVCLSVHPQERDEHRSSRWHFEVHSHGDLDEQKIKRYHMKALNSGVLAGLSRGPLLGFQVQHAAVQLHDFKVGYGTSEAMVTACAAQCVYQALRDARPQLLEPMMSMEIHTDEDRLGAVLGDLSRRRSQIFEIQSRQDTRSVLARTPLSELMGYATALRTATSGTAVFSMELADYEQMSEVQQRRAVRQVTGFEPL